MKVDPKWRGLIAGGMLSLLALTACQAIEPAASGTEKPPTAIASTAIREASVSTPATGRQTATPTVPPMVTVAPLPTTEPTASPEDPTPPSPTASPVQGEAADPPPLPFGLTMETSSFKGDPSAPVVIIEFSDYQ